MKGKATRKVVTSGRLTGAGKANLLNRNPEPASCPEPAYSLYSTDSEDQVTTLHKGLDRCAALLSGILEADDAASPSPPRTVKGGAVKSRLSTAHGKKAIKKPPTRTDQKSSQAGQRGPGSTTPRTHRPTVPPAHSGVKLHPPQKPTHTLLQSNKPHHPSSPVRPPHAPTPPLQPHAPAPPLPPHASVLLSMHQSSSGCSSASEAPLTQQETQCDTEEDFVPVRDITACSMKMSGMQLEAGRADEDSHGRQDSMTASKAKTVQYLLKELKALIAGQGSVAERLLSHLEQTVSSSHTNVNSSNIQTDSALDLSSLHSQNTQLRRRVRILNHQLKEREKAERHQNLEILCSSEEWNFQEELVTAQSRLQELQDDLTELREALEDTQSQLRAREAENMLVKTDLEATRRRLQDSEREKSRLASVAQQRLEEIGNLKRLLQNQTSSAVRQDPPVPHSDRITQYLMSLGQTEPETTPDALSQQSDRPACQQNSHPEPSRLSAGKECQRLSDYPPSHCDEESLWSNWSMKSGSTFNTRDEAAFREGLAALDASIASLQRTIQLDLRK